MHQQFGQCHIVFDIDLNEQTSRWCDGLLCLSFLFAVVGAVFLDVRLNYIIFFFRFFLFPIVFHLLWSAH